MVEVVNFPWFRIKIRRIPNHVRSTQMVSADVWGHTFTKTLHDEPRSYEVICFEQTVKHYQDLCA